MAVNPTSRSVPPGKSFLPLLVGLIMLALAGAGWWLAQVEMDRLDETRFNRLSTRLVEAVHARFQATEQALMGLQALVDNTGFQPTEAQWSRQVGLVEGYLREGMVGLGFAQRWSRSEFAGLEARQEAAGYPGFRVEPGGENPVGFVVTHIAPLARNRSALGLDLARGNTRRSAAEGAMRRGRMELSRRIQLISGEGAVPGLLLFQPVYHGGVVPPTESERERALVGWVYAAVRPDVLIKNATAPLGGQLDFEIFQGEATTAENLLIDNDGHLAAAGGGLIGSGHYAGRRFEQAIPLEMFGQRWTMRVSTLPAFDEMDRSFLPAVVGWAGVVVAICSALATWGLVNSRARALRRAHRMTENYQRAETESRRLALVASRTASAVMLADADWKIEWVNDGFTRITGYTLEEVKGRRPSSFLAGAETDPATLAAMDTAERENRPFKGELANYAKDGRRWWAEVEVQPLADERGQRSGYMSLMLDTTALKQAQETMARERARFQFIFESAPVGISWHIAGDAASHVVNPAHVLITGVSAEDSVRPGIFTQATHPDDVAPQRALAERLLRGEIDRFSLEKRYVHPDGRVVWAAFTSRIFSDERSAARQALTTLVDITEQKRQAEELRSARDVAERANLAKSQFLAMMSHEIRTPMNGVIGMTSLLLDSPLSKEQRDFVETIRYSGDALLAIINDILDFSKIESGRLELEQTEFSVRECVEGALDLLAPRVAEKRLDLLCEFGDGVPGQVRGDPTRLRQILVNLMGNAVKFTEHGEIELRVAAERVEEPAAAEVAAAAQGRSRSPFAMGERLRLVFAVRDTGIGISPAGQERLFQSFSQVDASTTRKFGGTGLGLVISKRLAELMGGAMWVESEEGRGSTFHFSLLVDALASKSRAWLPASTGSLAGKRLLIVDDNATNRRILIGMAHGWGMATRAVASGAAALTVLREGEVFDAAVLDMQMPEMDGVMLAQEIRRLRSADRLPLVMLSSLGFRELTAHKDLFAAGLTKPAKPAQLFELFAGLFHGPAGSAAASVAVPVVAPPVARRSERMLLAEDNTVNQKVSLLMLGRLGYRADVAANGLEAVDALRRQPYDIILMDVQMPEMDGLEASRRINALLPDRRERPWIIALTANAMQGDREACFAAGMDDYLSKPFKTEELAAALERARAARAEGLIAQPQEQGGGRVLH